ncbi:MAG: gephyrin-like molybdotransferase Glp [Acidimicrobiales bacterium]
MDPTLEVTAGASIRGAATDVAMGDEVIGAGTVLGPAHLGVLASIGSGDVLVVPRPRVGVLSTGDELVPPGRPLGPGQIHDSNRVMLVALVERSGCEAVDLGLLPDDPDVVAAALRDAAARCDVLVTSGGVRRGDFDGMKLVLGRIAAMDWMQVAIRPAKPFACGRLGDVPVLGLPGNPVSSLVSFELLARPALRRMAGHPEPDRPRVPAVAEAPFERRPDGKTHFDRVTVTFDGQGFHAWPVAAQGSHQLAASAAADGLAEVPDGPTLEAGATVGVLLLDPSIVAGLGSC